MNYEMTILSTRPLPAPLLEEAERNGIRIDIISFIHTEPVTGLDEQLADLLDQEITAVFTSMNAVEAVSHHVHHAPNWKIFCIGDATQAAVRRHFGEDVIACTAPNASALADVIINAGVKEAVFFCGDMRRPELPDKLSSAHVSLKEIMVYRTIPTPKKIEKTYAGILFFSPSAAESFFSVNTVGPYTVLFAIGNTTGNAIKKFTSNSVITSSEAQGKEELARHAISYFKTMRNAY